MKAPFSEDTISKIEKYQSYHLVHPLTCGNDSCRDDLYATKDSLCCPSCDYTQDWVPDYVLTLKTVEEMMEDMGDKEE